MGLIIDTPTNVTEQVQALKRANVEAVIRYEVRPPGGAWKRLQPNEAKAIGNAGLKLGLVYEGPGATPSYFTQAHGYADASYALDRMAVYGQPDNGIVYFAVDYDAEPSEVQSSIARYFDGVNKALASAPRKLRAGAYASGFCNQYLLRQGLIASRWITCSLGFRGSRAAVQAREYELWQTKCDTHLLGMDVDLNVANTEDWGQFVPFADGPVPPVDEQTQTGDASWYDDSTNADDTPVHNATDLSAAHRTLPFGTKLLVTRTDTSQSVEVTVHDRGPYVRGRIIDLRPAAAKALDMIDAGVVPVEIKVIK